jgi:hypothetical protein
VTVDKTLDLPPQASLLAVFISILPFEGARRFAALAQCDCSHRDVFDSPKVLDGTRALASKPTPAHRERLRLPCRPRCPGAPSASHLLSRYRGLQLCLETAIYSLFLVSDLCFSVFIFVSPSFLPRRRGF